MSSGHLFASLENTVLRLMPDCMKQIVLVSLVLHWFTSISYTNVAYDILEEAEKQDYNMKRYENAKVFLAALDSSDPSMANLHAIMESYHHARGQVVNLISHKLAKVMTLEDSEQVALDNILQSAARLWLDA